MTFQTVFLFFPNHGFLGLASFLFFAASINFSTKDWTQNGSFFLLLLLGSAGFAVAALEGLLVLLGRTALAVALTVFAEDRGLGVTDGARVTG